MEKKWIPMAALFFCAALFAGCAGKSGKAGAVYVRPAYEENVYDAAAAQPKNGAGIDISHQEKGYVAVSAISDARLKFQVNCGRQQYNYDMPSDGTPAFFPLQCGDGAYQFRVMKNTNDDKYIEINAVTANVSLENEFVPFTRPSEMVNYTEASVCAQYTDAITDKGVDQIELVKEVYAYVRDHVSYDYDKAAAVSRGELVGYLPQPDETFASGKGICYDYAALTAAMLRSQGIPTKMMTGYVADGAIYHAWNMIYLQEQGWITVKISVPANEWQRVDITFAAAGADASVAGDGTDYVDRYTY